MKSIFLLLILFTFLYSTELIAKEKVDFSGWGAAGYMFIDRNPLTDSNQPTYYLGKLQADIKITDELEAQLVLSLSLTIRNDHQNSVMMVGLLCSPHRCDYQCPYLERCLLF